MVHRRELLGTVRPPRFGAGRLIDQVRQAGIAECTLLCGACSLGKSNLLKLISFNVHYARQGMCVKLHDREGSDWIVYVNEEAVHEKSDHTGIWAFGVSAAVSKMGSNAAIRELRLSEGGVFNSRAINVYTLQDADKHTGDEVSVLLTGAVLLKNRTKFVMGAGTESHSKTAQEIRNIWDGVNRGCGGDWQR
jgi:hypothetical protein